MADWNSYLGEDDDDMSDRRDWRSTEKRSYEGDSSGMAKRKIRDSDYQYEQDYDWSTNIEDDGEENDWYAYENKKLAEKYGGPFIKAKYTDQGRVAYYCELCAAEMNAKKSLDMHCAGMKHLKRVNQRKQEMEEKGADASKGRHAPPPRGGMGDRDKRREPSPRDRYGSDNRGGYDAPGPSGRSNFDNQARRPSDGILNQLSNCVVKHDDDADLATNVASELIKSLKEYSHKTGDVNVAELLLDAEMKLSTVKALKVGMQFLSNSPPRSSRMLDRLTPPRMEDNRYRLTGASGMHGPVGPAPVSYPMHHLQSGMSRYGEGPRYGPRY